jgi:hypothetical protein
VEQEQVRQRHRRFFGNDGSKVFLSRIETSWRQFRAHEDDGNGCNRLELWATS